MGADALTPAFSSAQVAYVLSRRRPDGGFTGRRGGPDLYYTDFALRVLDLLSPGHEALGPAADYLTALPPPEDAVHTFSLLNCARLLARHGHAPNVIGPDLAALPGVHAFGALGHALPPSGESAPPDAPVGGPAVPPSRREGGSQPRSVSGVGGGRRPPFANNLHSPPPERRGGRGGRCLPPSSAPISATQTFIAALCRDLLGRPPLSPGEIDAIRSLRRSDGGFADTPEGPVGQTNATAATLALLTMAGTPDDELVPGAEAFLAAMQTPSGGLLAHADAPEPDLLSTFTGLVAADPARFDLRGVARFVRSLALPGGGFRGAPADLAADVEYTYYGVACLALLRAHLHLTAAGSEART